MRQAACFSETIEILRFAQDFGRRLMPPKRLKFGAQRQTEVNTRAAMLITGRAA